MKAKVKAKETPLDIAAVRLLVKQVKGLAAKRAVVCALVGHSRIVGEVSFGYVHCGRCGGQVGDTLGGATSLEGRPVIGHGCGKCKAALKLMTWRDTYLCRKRIG